MEWNAKWDWENLVTFNSKSIESSKKLQPTDWGIEEEGDIDAMSFNTSRSGGGSGSDLGLGSFAKSSITASTDSSSKEGIKTSNFTFEAFQCFAEDFNKKKEFIRAEQTGNSPPGEQLIGLKLGKRTYFENNSSLSVIPVSSVTAVKRIRSSGHTMPPPRCQVEGCNLDLSSAKGYHKKHKVCESHSKCPKVIVGGLERRFCQQCSRFHNLSEFDEKKRSCRRRLSDHNARRRKPHQEEIQFKSTGLSSPFYDGRQQQIFELQNYPLVHTEPASNPTLTSTHAINIFGHDSSRLLSCKGTRAEVFNQDLKDSTFSLCNLDAAQDCRRALSLLSANACGSQPEPVIYDHHMHVNHYSMHQPTMHAVPQGLPLASSAYWLTEQRPTDSHALTANTEVANHFQETQMIKMAYLSSYNANPSN